jgi:hypothetical protein
MNAEEETDGRSVGGLWYVGRYRTSFSVILKKDSSFPQDSLHVSNQNQRGERAGVSRQEDSWRPSNEVDALMPMARRQH